jgi:hypothetical protein
MNDIMIIRNRKPPGLWYEGRGETKTERFKVPQFLEGWGHSRVGYGV